MKNNGMTFGYALEELKRGKLIGRQAWSGEYWLSLRKDNRKLTPSDNPILTPWVKCVNAWIGNKRPALAGNGGSP